MTQPLFDTHAHLISDDWETYTPKPLRPDLPTPKYWIFTFAEIVTTSKLRLGYIQCGVAGIFGLWGYYGVRVYDWQVLAV